MGIFDMAEGHSEASVPSAVGDHELLVTAWMQSHSQDGERGAQVAVRQVGAELIRHLRFRELTGSSRRRQQSEE